MWGTAILAGSAVGVYSDMKATAKKYAKTRDAYLPDLETAKLYDPYKKRYKDCLDASLKTGGLFAL
jgi:sugar (pentulose or hexulose) kinase